MNECNQDSAYYTVNAEAFLAKTTNIDMSEQYAPFLAELPDGAEILDAGCGSGRDSLAFMNLGYNVQAFDASPAMVAAAHELTGLNVAQICFADMNYQDSFDGVWACASLLHVPQEELPSVLGNCLRALRPKGVLYCSFKKGLGEHWRDGRLFNDKTVDSLNFLLSNVAGFHTLNVWESIAESGKHVETWVAGLGRRLC